jgi:hypothetical protein
VAVCRPRRKAGKVGGFGLLAFGFWLVALGHSQTVFGAPYGPPGRHSLWYAAANSSAAAHRTNDL